MASVPAAAMARIVGAVLAATSAAASAHGDGAGSQWWEWWLWPLMFASATLYALGVRRLWRRAAHDRGLRASRVAAFAGGWLALAAALSGPVDALGKSSFAVHMVQHEILMLIAAPLLVLGNPLAALVWALPESWRGAAVRPFRSAAWRRVWDWLVTPPMAWSVHALALWAWHAPALFEAGLRHDAIHDLQHVSFVMSALLFWWALIRRRADGRAVLYVLTTMLHTGFLGALLTFAPHLWYPSYAQAANPWGLSALDDQQLGGLIMWVPAGALLLFAGLAFLARWLQVPERARPAALNVMDECG